MTPVKIPLATKASRISQFKSLRLLITLAVLFSGATAALQIAAQIPGETLVFPTSVQWPRQQGVTWYRLQIGGDETFRDIYFDARVVGDRFRVRDLEPGYYYWRIAPADNQLGEFSRPLRFFVPGGVVTSIPTRSRVSRRTPLY